MTDVVGNASGKTVKRYPKLGRTLDNWLKHTKRDSKQEMRKKMDDIEFENEYKQLHALTGAWDFMELFLQSYLEVLHAVNQDTDVERKRRHFKKLKEIALFQAVFSYSEYDEQISLGLDKVDEQNEPERENLQ